MCLNMCVCVRYKESHVRTACAAVTMIHPELGCLIGSLELQKFSIILLYAEVGSSPGQKPEHTESVWFTALCSLLL